MMMDKDSLKKIVEAMLFVSDRSLRIEEMEKVLKDDVETEFNLEDLLKELQSDYADSDKPFEIRFIAGGWSFATKSEYAPWIKKLLNNKPSKLSPSTLEVLAIIAYKQPVTRSEIDEIRGVDSSYAVNSLSERKLIKISGRKEVLGRPFLYITTEDFLRHFGLAHLSDLPLMDTESLERAAELIDKANPPELGLYKTDGSAPVEETGENIEVEKGEPVNEVDEVIEIETDAPVDEVDGSIEVEKGEPVNEVDEVIEIKTDEPLEKIDEIVEIENADEIETVDEVIVEKPEIEEDKDK
jgi:segregation and condensation protein B